MFAGEGACLAAAFTWAFTVALFRAPIELYGARAVNLAKCAVSSVMFAAAVWLLGAGDSLAGAPAGDLLLIGLSGLVGLTLGDSALFAAVGTLGPYRALLLMTLAPVFTALLALPWGGQRLSTAGWAGMTLTLAGIVLVLGRGASEPAGRTLSDTGFPTFPAASGGWGGSGVTLGVLAALGQAGGILLVKAGMSRMPFLPASLLRMAVAAAGLVLAESLAGRLARAGSLMASGWWGRVVVASFLGSFVGILLMMAGIQYCSAPVAAVLLSTTPVFSLLLDVSRGRERPTVRNFTGTLLAVAGVAVLSLA